MGQIIDAQLRNVPFPEAKQQANRAPLMAQRHLAFDCSYGTVAVGFRASGQGILRSYLAPRQWEEKDVRHHSTGQRGHSRL
jgi:hypothetical protein